jgi:hypothetical protein
MKENDRHRTASLTDMNMHMLMPQKVSAEDELCQLLRVETEEACRVLASVLPRVSWGKDNPWYAARLYDLLIKASKFNEPTLALAVCQVCNEHARIKSPSSDKTPLQELLDRAIKDQSHKVLEVSLPFSPGYLPQSEYLEHLGRISDKKMEALRVLLTSWQSVHGVAAPLPPEKAPRLLIGAVDNSNLAVLKFVLPLVAHTRQDRSAVLARAINLGNDKAAKFLFKHASVCEALLHDHDRLSDEEVGIAYNRFAESMDEMDILTTDYLMGDKFHLPTIRSRAQSMQLRNSAPQAQNKRPSRRL